VIRVGDKEAITVRIRQNLSRKGKRKIADFCALECELQRLFVQFAAFAKIVDGLGNGLID
jgi:hypothetical protein